MRIHYFLLLILATISSVSAAPKKSFAPSFYPFKNGVKYATVAEGAQAIKKMGYAGVGSVPANDLAEFLKEYDAAGLKVFSLYVGGKINAKGFTCDATVIKAIRMLNGSDALVELYVQGEKDATDEQAVAFVREMAAEAKKSGLRLVLYPHTGFYIDTVGDALRIAKASGCKNVGVAFNLCHFLKVEPKGDLRKTLEKAGPLLWSVSVCGADTEGTNWKSLIQPLDVGTFNQVNLLRDLREIGYRGHVGIQCYGLKIPSKEHLPRSLRAWKKNLVASVPKP